MPTDLEMYCENRAETLERKAAEDIKRALEDLASGEGDHAIGRLLDAVTHIGEARGFRAVADGASNGEI